MSGELKDYLLDPVVYPNWMWVLGLAIVVGVIGWILYSVWRWWTSRIGEVMELQTITDARRKKYLTFIDQIADRYADGDLDARGVHLALAGLMRALGTERTAATSRWRPCPRCASLSRCGRAWRTFFRRVKSPVSRATTSRRGSPRTRLSPAY